MRKFLFVSKLRIIIRIIVKGFREAANHASILLENKTMINTGKLKGEFLITLGKKDTPMKLKT